MRLRILGAVAGLMLAAGQVSAGEAPILKTDQDLVNYAIGVNLINNFHQQGVEIDLPLVMKGMLDAHEGKELLMDDAALARAGREYQNTVRQKQSMKARSGPAVANKAVGEKFLEENRKKEGVVSLPSGLQYKVLKDGSGSRAGDGKAVEYRFRATLLNGKEIGSSPADGQAAIYKGSEGALPGIAEALRLMRPGAKWQLFVPPVLAYGEKGDGGAIGPNTTLVYDVELLRIID